MRTKKTFSCNCGFVGGTSHNGLCLKCYNREYYKKNRAKIIQRAMDWAKNNPEHNRKLKREGARRHWNRLTPEQKIESSRKTEKRRSDEERSRRKERQKIWYQRVKDTEHQKDKKRRLKEARRARLCNVENTLTKKQWEKIKEAYNYCCAYCGCKPNMLTQDHVVPISKGGNHSADNIVPACMNCNKRKGTHSPPDGFTMKAIEF